MKLKYALVFSALVFGSGRLTAQDFPGFRSGNYTGVNGVFYNPANVAANPFRYDINLFSAHVLVGNDQASFKLSDLGSSVNGDSFSDQIFGKNAGNANGLANISLALPSVMFNVGPKWSFAVTSRSRVIGNINNLNGKLVDKVTEDFSNDPELPYTISSTDNMLVNLSGWTELGASAGRELLNKNGNRLKAGISLKYLSGIANNYLNIASLKGTINADPLLQDAYLSNTTGRIALGFAGANIADFEAGDLTKSNGSGFGADLGLVYEWKGTKGRTDTASMRISGTAPDYKLRIGVSLLDAGKIKFTRDAQRSSAYDIQLTGAERYYFSNLDDVELNNYKQKLDSRPDAFTPVAGNSTGSYSVSLPTTLQLDVDYHVMKSFYVNAGGQFALSSNSTTVYNSQYYNSFTLTPRIENRHVGLFLPINVNSLTDANVGAAVRYGPLMVGSGSVLSALTGSSKQADIFIGLHIGMLKK